MLKLNRFAPYSANLFQSSKTDEAKQVGMEKSFCFGGPILINQMYQFVKSNGYCKSIIFIQFLRFQPATVYT